MVKNESEQSTDVERIQKLIDGIKNNASALKTRIQECAAECVIHAVNYHNVTLATNLVKAIKGVKKSAAVIEWFQKNGPFQWREVIGSTKKGFGLGSDKKVQLLKEALRNDEPGLRNLLLDQKSNSVFGVKSNSKPGDFDILIKLQEILERANTLLADDKRRNRLKNAELLDKLRNLLEQSQDQGKEQARAA